jgi:hypothetical protein
LPWPVLVAEAVVVCEVVDAAFAVWVELVLVDGVMLVCVLEVFVVLVLDDFVVEVVLEVDFVDVVDVVDVEVVVVVVALPTMTSYLV